MDMTEDLPGLPVTCTDPDCQHEWRYKGKSRYITCSVCRKLFKNPHWKARVS